MSQLSVRLHALDTHAWISRQITVRSPDYDGYLPTTPLTPPKLPLSRIHSTPTIPWGNANFTLPIPFPIHQQVLSSSPLQINIQRVPPQFSLSQPTTTSCSGSCNRLQTVFSASLAPVPPGTSDPSKRLTRSCHSSAQNILMASCLIENKGQTLVIAVFLTSQWPRCVFLGGDTCANPPPPLLSSISAYPSGLWGLLWHFPPSASCSHLTFGSLRVSPH